MLNAAGRGEGRGWACISNGDICSWGWGLMERIEEGSDLSTPPPPCLRVLSCPAHHGEGVQIAN